MLRRKGVAQTSGCGRLDGPGVGAPMRGLRRVAQGRAHCGSSAGTLEA